MNIVELRSMLAEQMIALKNGKADPKHVNAMVNAAGKIIGSVRLELEYARMVGVTPTIPLIKHDAVAPRIAAAPKRRAVKPD
jgi:hypothetical protein